MACEIHIGDVGTRFIFTIVDCDGTVVDVSAVSNVTINFKKPDETLLSVVGTLLTDGTDGKVYYDTIAGDINQAGYWKVQGKVTFPTGTFYSDIHKFQVFSNL